MSDRLEEIEKRWAKTMHLPWWPAVDDRTVVGGGSGPTHYVAVGCEPSNREAIAEAPSDIAWLIAEVKRLRQEAATREGIQFRRYTLRR